MARKKMYDIIHYHISFFIGEFVHELLEEQAIGYNGDLDYCISHTAHYHCKYRLAERPGQYSGRNTEAGAKLFL